MRLTVSRVLATLLASASASASASAPALAQSEQSAPAQTAQEAGTDTDIIVTAQRREESIQDVPISIQAIGAQRLDQLNIVNFAQYTQLLPSVAFQSQQPGVTTVYMRGVASGGDGNHSGPLPSVGVYLDEQPVTTIGGTLDVHIYDIARIESLAGPQGTLFGASSEAGTIRIITNKPDASGFYGRIDGEANAVDEDAFGGRLEGMLNMPLAERIALRAVGFYRRDGGYIDNVPGSRSFLGPQISGFDPATQEPVTITLPGITVNNAEFVEKNYNDTEVYGGRAALGIDLDENWTVTPTVMYQKLKTAGSYAYDPSVGDLEVQRFFPEYRRDRFVQAALTIEGRVGNWDVTYAGSYMDRKTLQSSDYTDYSESYDSLYSSVGGLAGYFYYQDDAGNTIDPRQRVIGRDHFKKLSQELRVASPSTDRFRVVAGAFYQRQSNDIFQDYQIRNLGAAVSVNDRPGTLWLTQQERVDRDYALFGEASFDLTPRLTVTGGGRAYIYDNSLIGYFGFGRNPGVDPDDGRAFTAFPFNAAGSSQTGVAGCFLRGGGTLRDAYLNGGDTTAFLPPAVNGSFCTNLAAFSGDQLVPRNASGQGVTYRANLTWKPAEDVLLYGTWSRGFRPGGVNRRGDVADYSADFLTNYELGFKTTFGPLRLNGAVYHQDWDAFHFSFLGENSFTVIQNGPDARIRGVELDANLSLDRLTLTAAGAYTDAETRDDLCSSVACVGDGSDVLAPAGTRLPITPKFKVNGTARYTVPIGSARGYVQGLIAHQGGASSDIRVAKAEAIGPLRPYTTGNLAVGALVGNYSFEVFAQNIWDERAQLTRFQQCGTCDQRPYIVPLAPRTIGVRAGAKF